MTSQTSQTHVALIFGANGALGSELSRALVKRGYRVVISGRDVPKLEKLYDQLEAQGKEQPGIYPIDLAGASPNDYEQMAEVLEQEYGRIDLLLHCAISFKGLTPMEQIEPTDWVEALHVNLTAPWLITQALIPLLRKSTPCQVVFFGESPDVLGKAFWGSYGIAKHGLEGLSGSLAQELASAGVKVHHFVPPPLRSSHRAKVWKDDQAVDLVNPPEAAEQLLQALGVA